MDAVNDLIWVIDNGQEEIDFYLENVTSDQFKVDVTQLIKDKSDKYAIESAMKALQRFL